MAKKSKRQTRKSSGAASQSAAKTEDVSTKKYDTEFNPDYSQTIKDLRRIAMLAGSFFFVLIVLTFFLR